MHPSLRNGSSRTPGSSSTGSSCRRRRRRHRIHPSGGHRPPYNTAERGPSPSLWMHPHAPHCAWPADHRAAAEGWGPAAQQPARPSLAAAGAGAAAAVAPDTVIWQLDVAYARSDAMLWWLHQQQERRLLLRHPEPLPVGQLDFQHAPLQHSLVQQQLLRQQQQQQQHLARGGSGGSRAAGCIDCGLTRSRCPGKPRPADSRGQRLASELQSAAHAPDGAASVAATMAAAPSAAAGRPQRARRPAYRCRALELPHECSCCSVRARRRDAA